MVKKILIATTAALAVAAVPTVWYLNNKKRSIILVMLRNLVIFMKKSDPGWNGHCKETPAESDSQAGAITAFRCFRETGFSIR